MLGRACVWVESTSQIFRCLRLAQSTTQIRLASHAAQGRANKAAPGPGKRLGAKRGATELVVPGNIIFRQRGTHWFPGENCGMGRDHTIFAKEKGYVVYYRDKWRGKGYGGAGRGHDFKKFIGVVFERGDTLPRPEGRERPRRLNLVTRIRREFSSQSLEAALPQGNESTDGHRDQAAFTAEIPPLEPKSHQRKPRQTNWEIGRAAEKEGVEVRKFEPGNRFLAWRKRTKRIRRAAQFKSLKQSQKQRGKKKNKTVRVPKLA